jgi:hypothetical protein
MRTITLKQREWLLITIYYFSYFMGDLYYLLMVFFYEDIPQFGHISEFSWLSSYLALVLLMNSVGGEGRYYKSRLLWLVPLFTGASYIYFIQFGDYVYEFMCDSTMTIVMIFAIRNLLYLRHNGIKSQSKLVFRLSMCMVTLEYCEWYSSGIWYQDDSFSNPYYIFELIIPIFMALFIPVISIVLNEKKSTGERGTA